MDLLADLNEPQRRAVTHVDGPLLVLAGAGSGKTRVIIRRAAYLIERGVAPWNVLAITFTNKAAGEMRQRLEAMGTAPGTTVSTFHALCAMLLREFAEVVGLSRNYTIYDRDDQRRLIKEAMVRLNLPSDRLSPQAVHAAISRAKNALQTPQAYAEQVQDFSAKHIAKVYEQYDRLLASNNALDFDDLLLRTAMLMRDHPDIRDQLRHRYRYVMIDEYQDTNRAQYILAHGIAGEHRNLCATGDPDQSIYAWRGADINNILEFERDYPNAVVIHLEENYRSTKAILAAASLLIECNTARKDKALWTRRDQGADVRVVRCDDERAEADAVARAILKRQAEGRRHSEVAVFYRVNALSRVMEETLLRAGIAYRVARGVEFYNRKEIRDVLAYLKIIANPMDDLSCARVINTPARGIGATTLKRLKAFAWARPVPLLEACRCGEQAGLGKAAAKKTAAFADMIDELSQPEALDRSVGAVLEDVVERSGLREMLQAADDRMRQPAENVGELISAATQFDTTSGDKARLVDFLHHVGLVSDADHMAGSSGAVTLMTLHAAKGLEFPSVFIIGCEEGMLPFRRQFSDAPRDSEIEARALEEERRLAFVGMTRAQDELVLSHVLSRRIRGLLTPQAASRFIGEIAGPFVTTEDITTDRSASRRGRRRGGFYADGERAEIEALDAYDSLDDAGGQPLPPEYEHLRKGCRVYHQMFGYGQVTRVRNQPWPDTRVEVFFDDIGPKKLVLIHAPLELL